MSAILVFNQSDKISLLTDAAHYTVTGDLVAAAPKCYALPHLNCAIAWRGGAYGSIVAPILEAIAPLESFDQIERSLPELLKSVAAVAEAQGNEPEPFEIHIAGYSRGAGRSYLMNNHRHQPGIDPYTVTPTGPVMVSPGDAELNAEIASRWPNRSIDDLDPETMGLEIMELQRGQKYEANFHGLLPKICIVGGVAQMTTVWPDHIETRILRRWPDKRGAPIAA